MDTFRAGIVKSSKEGFEPMNPHDTVSRISSSSGAWSGCVAFGPYCWLLCWVCVLV